MKNFYTSIPFALLMFFSIGVQAQKSKTLTPIEFSDRMSDITDSLYKKGSAWGSQFNKANEQHDFASLKPYREAVQKFLNSSLKSLRTMPDVKNSTALRLSMIEFLEFESKMVIEGFMPVEKIKANASDEEVQSVYKRLTNLADQESLELKKVATEQNAYAKANGFRIETEEEAGKEELRK